MKKLKFSADAPGIEELTAALRSCKTARERDRLRGLVWLREGVSVQDVARRLNVGRNTPAGWVRRLNAEGVEGLSERERTGRPARLTPMQKELVVSILTEAPESHNVDAAEWTPDALAKYLDVNFGVVFSRGALYKLLSLPGKGKRGRKPKKAGNGA